MDLLTHALSGAAIGTVVAGFSNRGVTAAVSIVFISGFAGILPDFDAISLWSGFDKTLGDLFNLSHKGSDIYSAKYWYSHHGFFHSALAGLLMTGLVWFLVFLSGFIFEYNKDSLGNTPQLRLVGFLAGFYIHLIEDMPTPASTWGGVNLFWPSKNYVGGTGEIWWWNNYDIFLIVAGVLVVNLVLLLAGIFFKTRLKKIIVGIFIAGCISGFVQIKTRTIDFAYTGDTSRFYEFEKKSKELQKEILGDKLFRKMEKFDNKLKFNF